MQPLGVTSRPPRASRVSRHYPSNCVHWRVTAACQAPIIHAFTCYIGQIWLPRGTEPTQNPVAAKALANRASSKAERRTSNTKDEFAALPVRLLLLAFWIGARLPLQIQKQPIFDEGPGRGEPRLIKTCAYSYNDGCLHKRPCELKWAHARHFQEAALPLCPRTFAGLLPEELGPLGHLGVLQP